MILSPSPSPSPSSPPSSPPAPGGRGPDLHSHDSPPAGGSRASESLDRGTGSCGRTRLPGLDSPPAPGGRAAVSLARESGSRSRTRLPGPSSPPPRGRRTLGVSPSGSVSWSRTDSLRYVSPPPPPFRRLRRGLPTGNHHQPSPTPPLPFRRLRRGLPTGNPQQPSPMPAPPPASGASWTSTAGQSSSGSWPIFFSDGESSAGAGHSSAHWTNVHSSAPASSSGSTASSSDSASDSTASVVNHNPLENPVVPHMQWNGPGQHGFSSMEHFLESVDGLNRFLTREEELCLLQNGALFAQGGQVWDAIHDESRPDYSYVVVNRPTYHDMGILAGANEDQTRWPGYKNSPTKTSRERRIGTLKVNENTFLWRHEIRGKKLLRRRISLDADFGPFENESQVYYILQYHKLPNTKKSKKAEIMEERAREGHY